MSDLLSKYGVKADEPEKAPSSILDKYGVSTERAPNEAELPADREKLGPISVSKNRPKSVMDWLKAFGGEFTKDPDPSAKAMFQSMSYPGNAVRNSLLEVAKRAGTLGQEGLGADEWKRTIKGDATSAPELLQKQGFGPVASVAMGLPLSVATDPYGGLMSGQSFSQAPTRPGIWQALAQTAEKPTSAVATPIAKGLQKAGEVVFRQPFKAADAKFLQFKDSAKFGPKAYSKLLWNEGDPLVGGFKKNNTALKEELEGVRTGAWDSVKEDLAQVPEVDLAPRATSEISNNAVENVVGEQVKRAQSAMEKAGVPKEQISDEASRLKAALREAAQNPDDEVMAKLMAAAQDKASRKFKDGIKKDLFGEKNARAKGAAKLKEIAPDMGGIIDEQLERFSTGDQTEARQALSQIIDDVVHGPRDIEQLQKLGQRYGRGAAGSDASKTNIYKEGSKINPRQVTQAGQRKTITDVIEENMERAVDAGAPKEGMGRDTVERFQANKKRYATAARGNQEAFKVLEKAEKTPLLSKADQFILGAMVAKPWLALPFASAKGGQLLSRSPRVATGTGKVLNNLGRSSIWDSMLKRNVLENLSEEKK